MHAHLALQLRKQAGEDPEHGRLARAIRSLEAERLARGDGKGQIAKNAAATPFASEVLHFDKRNNRHACLAGRSSSAHGRARGGTDRDSGLGGRAVDNYEKSDGFRQMFVVRGSLRERLTMTPDTGSIHMLSAIDGQRRAGDEAGVIGHQERDAAGNLLGLAQAGRRGCGRRSFPARWQARRRPFRYRYSPARWH